MKAAIQFSNTSPRQAFILTASMLAGSLLFYAAVLSFDVRAGQIIVVTLPLAAVICSFIDFGPDKSAYSDGSPVLPQSFYRLVIALFVLTVALSVARGFYPNGMQIEEFDSSREIVTLALASACMVVAIVAAALKDNVSFGAFGYAAFTVVVIAYSIALLIGLNTLITGVAFSIANGILGMIAWALLATISSQSGLSAVKVYGFGFSAFMLGSTIGWPVGFLIDWLGAIDLANVYGAAVLAIVAFVGFFLFKKSDLIVLSYAEDFEEEGVYSSSAFSDNQTKVSDQKPRSEIGRKPWWRLKMGEIAQGSNLTTRETEVFMLMAKGRNARSISEELCISYNTARTHVRNIYAKLNVHSRTEFDRIVDERDSPEEIAS